MQTFNETTPQVGDGISCQTTYGASKGLTRECNNGNCPADCVGSWGTCSTQCGPGMQTFNETTPQVGYGISCQTTYGGSKGSTRECNNGVCPADCVGSWSACSTTCNPGTRTYSVTIPKVGNGTCEAKDKDIQFCNTTVPCIGNITVPDSVQIKTILNTTNKYIVFNYESTLDKGSGYTEYTFTVTDGKLKNSLVLIVGGGGGGGREGGGGGGGDVGLLDGNIDPLYSIPIGTHKIRVGKGGIGSREYSNSGGTGVNSSLILNSNTTNPTYYNYCGGGGGGSYSSSPTAGINNSYSSGGGGGGSCSRGYNPQSFYYGGSGNGRSGNGGASGQFPIGTGGGGGAANANANGNGVNGTYSDNSGATNGNGGKGIDSDISGSNVSYGGGGGGGSVYHNYYLPGLGVDGGGKGARYDTLAAIPGTNGTGGGGGGGGVDAHSFGANGGHGVVILRYSTK
jgi:hypothetical protein